MSKKICVFGASITRGYYDREMGGWVNRLWLDLLNSRDDLFLIDNFGVSGDATNDLLKRYEVECQAVEPKTIIIAIGNNDSSYRKSLESNYILPEEYRKNVLKLIELGGNYTKEIVLVGLTPVLEEKTTPFEYDEDIFYFNKNINEYNNILSDLATENNLVFVPMFDLLFESDFHDGLHPNAEGHEKMYQRVKEYLLKNKII